ncbi:lipoate--protein ligase [Halanaerobium hydrogeniformans]|uniref:lipoate--protein ligase n=1 Tax=Halanaerobium hydrogeniformans TaxID=656519 RepID=E4RKV5_HALHG|nr:lipoate--protein ligase [Halanaerobium hydrogeniformans]ADQ15696.1 lipoyltransferase and lipoate-protein ligase [Halanaerobium hydrogeniformans]
MSINRSKIVYSEEYNPWYNLALEEYLLNNLSEDEIILYLWQNDNTVVIGRNQNAWKECRCSQLEESGGYLARRISGGGAVYHDLGNLNFTFLMGRKYYDLHKQLSVILKAVRNKGIEAEFSGRNDLITGGKKFSGNAFYFGSKKAYHHGTLLLDSNLNALVKFLELSQEKIISKGIDSVRSQVVNLKSINEDLNLEILKKELEKTFAEVYLKAEQIKSYKPSKMEELSELYNKYSSWEWRYGAGAEFDIVFENSFAWGELEINLNLVKAVIKDVEVYTDSIESNLFIELEENLKGKKFKRENLISAVDNLNYNKNQSIISDLKVWFKNRDL